MLTDMLTGVFFIWFIEGKICSPNVSFIEHFFLLQVNGL